MTPDRIADPTSARGHLWRVGLAMAVGLVTHAWLIAHTGTTARDSVGFAQLALLYESPDPELYPDGALGVLKRAEPPHPPGYPLAVLAASKLVRAVAPGELPDQMLKSTQVASAFAALLWVIPCYALGVQLFGRFEGFAAALLLQIVPVVARVTSDGLTEAWYLLFYTSAAAAGTWALRRPAPSRYALAGLFSGLAYLVRPEGLLAAFAVAAAGAWLALLRRDGKGAVAAVVCVALGALVPAGPYMATIGGLSLKPSVPNTLPLVFESARAPAAGPLWAMNYDPARDGPRAVWVPRSILDEGLKAANYGVAVYAFIGLALALADYRRRPWLAATLALFLLNFAVVVALASRKGYVSERHTLPLVVLSTFYAAFSFGELPRLMSKLPNLGFFGAGWWKWVGLAALVISCLAVVFKPLHGGRHGHRLIGDYLKDHATMEDVVIDPYTFAQYFSGRSVRGVPPDPPAPRYRWAILEEGESNFSLTRVRAAIDVVNDRDNPAVLTLSWDDPAKAGRRVSLYRQTVRR